MAGGVRAHARGTQRRGRWLCGRRRTAWVVCTASQWICLPPLTAPLGASPVAKRPLTHSPSPPRAFLARMPREWPIQGFAEDSQDTQDRPPARPAGRTTAHPCLFWHGQLCTAPAVCGAPAATSEVLTTVAYAFDVHAAPCGHGPPTALKRTASALARGCYSALAGLASHPYRSTAQSRWTDDTPLRARRGAQSSSDLPAPHATSGRLADRTHAPRVPSGIGRNLVFKDPHSGHYRC